jgi:hypothetical protein
MIAAPIFIGYRQPKLPCYISSLDPKYARDCANMQESVLMNVEHRQE